uniref:Uncharacterized protein n=1 Tax=Strongyloides papillosus TaxID=174720 RepID=A0A0N5BEQ4_STREA
MIRQDTYYYFTISGLPSMVIPQMLRKYIENKNLKYIQVQSFNYLGAFRIVGYDEPEMIKTESHFKDLKRKIKIDGIKYLFFFSEHKKIRLLLNRDMDVSELEAYFIRHQLLVSNMFKADFHLQQLNGAIILPVNGQMLQFLRNDDIPPSWEDEAIHRDPFNRKTKKTSIKEEVTTDKILSDTCPCPIQVNKNVTVAFTPENNDNTNKQIRLEIEVSNSDLEIHFTVKRNKQ